MRLPAPLLRLFPPPAAPEDEAALSAHLDEMMRFYGCGCAIVLNVLHLLFWPTDRFFLPSEPVVQQAMFSFRTGTFAVHALFLLALLVPALRRRTFHLVALTICASSVIFGSTMARLGGLSGPPFYLMYLAPLGLGAMPVRPLRRFWLSPACAGVLCLSYFARRPGEVASPLFGSAVAAMGFVVAVSVTIGQGIFILSRREFLTGRALAQSRAVLKEYTEHLEDKVAEHAQQLRRLAAYREQAAAQERARLARELHDEVGQQITGLRYALAGVRIQSREDRTRAALASLEQGADELHEAVRSLATELRPRVLEDQGLGPALRWLIERTGERTGLQVSLEQQGDLGVVVPPEQATAVFRIIQESLTNALRHARPRSLRVAVAVTADALDASVTDDGCGMPPLDITRAGMGLFGMSERAVALGGRLAIESQPGSGTVVRLQLPLRGAG